MKKLLILLTLVFLFSIPVKNTETKETKTNLIAKDIPIGYFCWCMHCGATHNGTTALYICPVCRSSMGCQVVSVRL